MFSHKKGVNMKAFAELKRRPFSSGVASASLPDRDFDYHPEKSSRGRLHAVPPRSAKTITPMLTIPMLTTEEFIQVRLATVRESNKHRFWPTEVLARFAAADVIR